MFHFDDGGAAVKITRPSRTACHIQEMRLALDVIVEIPYADIRSRVVKTDSFDAALDILTDTTLSLGFTQVLYGYIPAMPRLPNGDWLPLKLNVRNFPTGFDEGWAQFMRIDPYYRACFETTLPIDWRTVQKRSDISTHQRQAFQYLEDFGLTNGITVPVHLPFGKFAVMSAICDKSCGGWAKQRQTTEEPLFRLMHAFTRGLHERNLESQIPTELPRVLTPREKECLKWASAGKTSGEIAQIIDRSVETVRLHIKNAITKLDATNRAQAVATAINLGLV